MKEITISVHGTFAAQNESQGQDWWQHSGDFWQRLSTHLPELIEQVDINETFHWNGDNAASERRLAAEKLLDLLIKFEAEEQPYHLIGHSHGGSVIWDAFQLAAIRHKAKKSEGRTNLIHLDFLKSWTTVGTPFLLFRPSMLRIGLAFVTGLLTVMMAGYFLTHLTQYGIYGEQPWTWWALLFMAVLFFYAFLASTIKGLECFRAYRENAIAHRIIREIGDRWLCLYHPDDEAINGIRSALKASGDIVPRRNRLRFSFSYPRLGWFFVPLALIVNPLYNYLVAPFIDTFVWGRIQNAATGNNRPGVNTERISIVPTLQIHQLPELPGRVSDQITNFANESILGAADKIRQLLGRLSTGGGKDLVGEIREMGLSGKELVHTSYFENENVAKLIAFHMGNHSGWDGDIPIDEDLSRWMQHYQLQLQNIISAESSRMKMRWVLLIFALVLILFFIYIGLRN